MEILRFDNAESTTPQRKRSSKGMLAVGLVATLFGISSAFASSTITINGSAPVALGQGVTAVTACDNDISIAPITEMSVIADEPTFSMTNLVVSNINTNLPDPVTGAGCGGKTFDVQVFDVSKNPYDCTALNSKGTVKEAGNEIPLTSTCTGSKLSFGISTAYNLTSVYTVEFNSAPAEISYITIVSRES